MYVQAVSLELAVSAEDERSPKSHCLLTIFPYLLVEISFIVYGLIKQVPEIVKLASRQGYTFTMVVAESLHPAADATTNLTL